MLITAVFMIFMPAFIGLIGAGWTDEPTKFGLAVDLTRITMPYLVFICLVSLFSGVLNSLSRFTAAAFAPSLLNVTLIAALLIVPEGGPVTARAMAWGVVAGRRAATRALLDQRAPGRRQAAHRAPAHDAGVKEMLSSSCRRRWAAASTISARASTLISRPACPRARSSISASRTVLSAPLAIIGSALGTAILPSISRAVGGNDNAGAARGAEPVGRAVDAADPAGGSGASGHCGADRRRTVPGR
jgi:putative peptidoglycan lipid II flippase